MKRSTFNVPDWRDADKKTVVQPCVAEAQVDRSTFIATPTATNTTSSGIVGESNDSAVSVYSVTIETPSDNPPIGKVSFFDHNRQQEPVRSMKYGEVAEFIKHDPHLPHLTADVRRALAASGGDKRASAVTQAKSCLPAIAVSGTVTKRAGAEGLLHSGLIQVDVDGLTPEEVEACKPVVANDSSAVLVFVSPTGTGVKAMVRVEKPASGSDVTKWHALAFATVECHFREKYGITIDPSPKNPASLMYLCHDPEPAGRGEDATPLVVIDQPTNSAKPSAAAEFSTWAKQQGYVGDLRTLDAEKLATESGRLVKVISSKKIGVTCPWENEHTTATTGSDTVLLVNPDAAGIKVSFKCKHGHCESRNIRHFLEQCPREIVDRCCLAEFNADKLRPGVELPGDNRLLSDFADELGRVLKNCGVYARGGLVMVIHKGESVVLTPDFLRTWGEAHVYTYLTRGKGDDKFEVSRSMSSEAARAVILAPQFAQHLPELVAVIPVRTPVTRASGCIELLPTGYDAETKIFTLEGGVQYATDWPAERGREFLEELLADFPFADDAGRSKSVAIAAMLAVYAPLLIDPLAPRPTFIYIANSEGSGKTLLAQIAGATHGIMPVTSAPKNEEEWQKKILATVISGTSFLLLDNAKGFLNSPSLEALLTSPKYEGRVLGSSKIYRGDANFVVIITGNDLMVTPDLSRRALFVELFSEALRAEDRVFSRVLDAAEILRLQPQILSALWSLISEWDRKGRPAGTTTNASFPRWAATFGGILESAGYANPCTRQEIEGMVDPDISDMLKLTRLVKSDHEYPFSELAMICKNEGLFERATNEIDDLGILNRKGKSILGRIFKRFSGKVVSDELRFISRGTGHKRAFTFKPLRSA